MQTKQATTRPDRLARALERHEGRLVRYAARITRDVERAREVVQDTFLRLCRSGDKVPDDRVTEWLFTVCRNRALDVRKKEKRMKPLVEGQIELKPGPDASPPEAVEKKETAGRMLHAVGHLPENQQEVIRLKFQEGLSYREIGRVIKLSPSNVGYLIHTALKALRASMKSRPGMAPNA